MEILLLFVIGILSGFAISSGVFALITALSLIPRMADKTYTAKYIKHYESAVLYGSLLGNVIYFIQILIPQYSIMDWWNENFLGNTQYFVRLISNSLLLIVGCLMGMFVGTLAVSIAESLDVTAVFLRRSRLHVGLAWIVFAFAFGKMVGAFYFFLEIL